MASSSYTVSYVYSLEHGVAVESCTSTTELAEATKALLSSPMGRMRTATFTDSSWTLLRPFFLVDGLMAMNPSELLPEGVCRWLANIVFRLSGVRVGLNMVGIVAEVCVRTRYSTNYSVPWRNCGAAGCSFVIYQLKLLLSFRL